MVWNQVLEALDTTVGDVEEIIIKSARDDGGVSKQEKYKRTTI